MCSSDLPISRCGSAPLFILPISRCGSAPLFILPISCCGSAHAFYTYQFLLRQHPRFLYCPFLVAAAPRFSYCPVLFAAAPPLFIFTNSRCGSAPAIYTDRKSTRLNSSHQIISYAVFCLKKKKKQTNQHLLKISP